MRFLQNIIVILSACFLPCCSLISSTKLTHHVVDLLPTLLVVAWLSPFASCNLRWCREVGSKAFPKITWLLLIANHQVFLSVQPCADENNVVGRRPFSAFSTLHNCLFTTLSSSKGNLGWTEDTCFLTLKKVNEIWLTPIWIIIHIWACEIQERKRRRRGKKEFWWKRRRREKKVFWWKRRRGTSFDGREEEVIIKRRRSWYISNNHRLIHHSTQSTSYLTITSI